MSSNRYVAKSNFSNLIVRKDLVTLKNSSRLARRTLEDDVAAVEFDDPPKSRNVVARSIDFARSRPLSMTKQGHAPHSKLIGKLGGSRDRSSEGPSRLSTGAQQ